MRKINQYNCASVVARVTKKCVRALSRRAGGKISDKPPDQLSTNGGFKFRLVRIWGPGLPDWRFAAKF